MQLCYLLFYLICLVGPRAERRRSVVTWVVAREELLKISGFAELQSGIISYYFDQLASRNKGALGFGLALLFPLRTETY